MGRERQKRKNRSSISKVRQRTKSKKLILSNPIIAANWDKNQTLTQNYKRLGLATKLNGQSGGAEKDVSAIIAAKEQGDEVRDKQDSLQIRSSSGVETLVLGEAKVQRESKTGRIVQVISTEEETKRANPLADPLNDLDSDLEEEDTRFALTNQHGNTNERAKLTSAPATSVVQQLEERASVPAAKYKRKQTENEQAFVKSLVTKYGHDYAKMARDMKLNYMQRSEGDLRRRIKIWEDNGGTID